MTMKLLLDTQVLIWWLAKDKHLKQPVKVKIQEAQEVRVSVVSVWEMEIKRAVKKLDTPLDIKYQLKRHDFGLMDVNVDHALEIRKLTLIHRDPFDRMLVAQARVEKLTIVTADPKIEKYEVKVVRA